jgi:hypothetical protein
VEKRIPLGPVLGLAGAILLAVSLFLDWWDGVTAFTAFESLDLALVAIALMFAVAVAGELAPRARAPLGERWALPLAFVALAIVASQLVNDPPLVAGDGGPGHAVGAWLALGGALAMVAGALLTVTTISLAVDVRRRDGSGSEAPTVAERGTEAADDPRRP